MGFLKNMARKLGDAQAETTYFFELGCDVLGTPAGGYWRCTHSERVERVAAGRREHDRREQLRSQVDRSEGRMPRPEKDWGWYSKYVSKDGTIHVMLDASGNQTTSYPHVHIIHDEPNGEIRVVLSRGPQDHPERVTLPGSATAADLDYAVRQFQVKL